MQLLKHDLPHEFPEYKDVIPPLKSSNPHFAKLADEYEVVNKQIRRIEENNESITDAAMEVLKRERLRLKDELYRILRGHAQA